MSRSSQGSHPGWSVRPILGCFSPLGCTNPVDQLDCVDQREDRVIRADVCLESCKDQEEIEEL